MIEGQTIRQTDGRTGGRMDRWTDGSFINFLELMLGRTNIRSDKRRVGQTSCRTNDAFCIGRTNDAFCLGWTNVADGQVSGSDKCRVGQMSVRQTSVRQTSVGQMSVGQTSVGQTSVGQTLVAKKSRHPLNNGLYFEFQGWLLYTVLTAYKTNRLLTRLFQSNLIATYINLSKSFIN